MKGCGLVLNRLKKLSVVVAAVFAFAAIGMTAVYADDGFTAYVVADALNIRSAPSTDSDVLGQAFFGDALTIESVSDNWGQVSYNDSDAYVCMDYITTRQDDVSRGSLGDGQGALVLEYAKRFLGTPYKYGGMSPSGFDCSGFVGYVYQHFGVTLPRVAADMAKVGTAVSRDELQPGDIMLFYSKVGGKSIGHAAIYAGNGVMIHAPQTGDVVKVMSIDSGSYGKRFACARRVL